MAPAAKPVAATLHPAGVCCKCRTPRVLWPMVRDAQQAGLRACRPDLEGLGIASPSQGRRAALTRTQGISGWQLGLQAAMKRCLYGAFSIRSASRPLGECGRGVCLPLRGQPGFCTLFPFHPGQAPGTCCMTGEDGPDRPLPHASRSIRPGLAATGDGQALVAGGWGRPPMRACLPKPGAQRSQRALTLRASRSRAKPRQPMSTMPAISSS